jgi:hypothetical protein
VGTEFGNISNQNLRIGVGDSKEFEKFWNSAFGYNSNFEKWQTRVENKKKNIWKFKKYSIKGNYKI